MKSNKQPEIRFPGFTEDWEQRKLGEISVKVTQKNKDRIFNETFTNSAEFGIISQNDFFDKQISNNKNIDGYYVVAPDDFVYNPRISNYAPVGPIKRNKLDKTGIMSPLYYVFKTIDIEPTFLEKYFDTVYWHKFMKLNGDSGARADRFAIKDSIFKEMPIPFPVTKEQIKIGDFFKSFDDTIALHQQELTTLKETKQGFLQKMFPKEGERVPEIRFPGFTEDWELRKLGDEAGILAGGDVDKTKLMKEGNYPVIANALTNDGILGYYEEHYRVEAPAVTVTGRGDVGHAQARKVNFTPVVRLLSVKSNHDVDFLEHTINNQRVSVESTGVPQLTSPQLSNYKVWFTYPGEEKRIGHFFKQLDDTIALHQRELDLLKETKKAFLQKMFV